MLVEASCRVRPVEVKAVSLGEREEREVGELCGEDKASSGGCLLFWMCTCTLCKRPQSFTLFRLLAVLGVHLHALQETTEFHTFQTEMYPRAEEDEACVPGGTGN